MADTVEYFTNFLPKKIADNAGLQGKINDSIVFDITGAGVWTLDLKTPPGSVTEGAADGAGCTITVTKENWEALLAKPSLGMQLFMTGKLKVKGKQGLAMQLASFL